EAGPVAARKAPIRIGSWATADVGASRAADRAAPAMRKAIRKFPDERMCCLLIVLGGSGCGAAAVAQLRSESRHLPGRPSRASAVACVSGWGGSGILRVGDRLQLRHRSSDVLWRILVR